MVHLRRAPRPALGSGRTRVPMGRGAARTPTERCAWPPTGAMRTSATAAGAAALRVPRRFAWRSRCPSARSFLLLGGNSRETLKPKPEPLLRCGSASSFRVLMRCFLPPRDNLSTVLVPWDCQPLFCSGPLPESASVSLQVSGASLLLLRLLTLHGVRVQGYVEALRDFVQVGPEAGPRASCPFRGPRLQT